MNRITTSAIVEIDKANAKQKVRSWEPSASANKMLVEHESSEDSKPKTLHGLFAAQVP